MTSGELIERLREDGHNGHNPLCLKAVAHIEALTAENERLAGIVRGWQAESRARGLLRLPLHPPHPTHGDPLMTTITHEQAAAIEANIKAGWPLEQAFAGGDITIAPPEPPEAMVKLARGIVLVTGIEEGSLAWEWGMKAALAALQYVDKVVVAHGLGDGTADFAAIRRKLGAIA